MKKSARTLFIALLVSGVCTGTLFADRTEWIKLKQKQYGFKVRFPEQPEETMEKRNYLVGTVVNHTYTARKNKQVFRVNFSELPELAVTFVGEEEILDETRSGILRENFGKQVSYMDITLRKREGKKLIYETSATDDHPGMKGEAIFFLKENKLYVAEALSPLGQLPGNADRFFASFKIK